jgi:tRNA-specific 2-thiouridylase
MNKSKIRIVVAMSGGVDSSVVATILKREGYDVIGIMLRLWSESSCDTNRCCTPESIENARLLADQLEIPFYVLDYQQPFMELVVGYFTQVYSASMTPNPCLVCNKKIRFGKLLKEALALDAQYLATGHYAQIRQKDGIYQLHRGVDLLKDQSYVLYQLDQYQLSYLKFPLGDFHKTEVRRLAQEYGLAVAKRPDSQDLCFVGDSDYREFLKKTVPGIFKKGELKNQQGEVLGTHNGLPGYTIGQRRGLGISGTAPYYVTKLDTATNTLWVGKDNERGQKQFWVDEVKYISGKTPEKQREILVKIRYTSKTVPAILIPNREEKAEIVLEKPLNDITPGQSAVFYQGEQVVGGGIIQGGEE